MKCNYAFTYHCRIRVRLIIHWSSSYNNIYIITLIVAAIVTFIVTYYCVKKKFGIEFKLNSQPPQETALYEQMCPSNKTITKHDFELQPNSSYGTSDKVIIISCDCRRKCTATTPLLVYVSFYKNILKKGRVQCIFANFIASF